MINHRWWAGRQNPRRVSEDTSISSLDAETPSKLMCRVADIHSAPSGLVLRFLKRDDFILGKFIFWLRLEDGTKCNLRTVEFCGLNTQTDEVSKAPTFALSFMLLPRWGRKVPSLTCGWTQIKAGRWKVKVSGKAAWFKWRTLCLSMLGRRTMLS